MTLAQYLRENRMTTAAFAAHLCVSQVTVHRYIKGRRFPDRETILRINRLTSGQVSPSDWFGPAPRQGEVA